MALFLLKHSGVIIKGKLTVTKQNDLNFVLSKQISELAIYSP